MPSSTLATSPGAAVPLSQRKTGHLSTSFLRMSAALSRTALCARPVALGQRTARPPHIPGRQAAPVSCRAGRVEGKEASAAVADIADGEEAAPRVEAVGQGQQPASSSGRENGEGGQPEVPYSLVCALGGLGALETAYLTWVKLNGGTPVCLATGGSCAGVLNSAYGAIAGVPLPALGLAAYGLVAVLAGLGAVGAARDSKDSEWQIHNGLIAGSAVLFSTSAVLMYVLATRLGGETCPWCLASAGLSTGIAGAVGSGFSGEQLRKRVAPLAGGASASVILALTVAFSGIPASASTAVSAISLPYNDPPITTHSSDAAVSMAHRLKEAGAKMYGAFWCSHCYAQKDYFGQEAMAEFPYVECFPEGFYRGEGITTTTVDKACSAAGIQGFPTWVINGVTYEGEQSLEQLETALTAK